MSQTNESDPQTPAVPYAYVGEIRLLPFRHDELPFGWYFCNGERYELSSPQAQVLTGLSENYRADWGLETDECSISLPNLFNEEGRGGFLRPVDGAARQVGTAEGDAIRNITGDARVRTGMNPVNMEGCFKISDKTAPMDSYGSSDTFPYLAFDASLSVPTAEENRPFNLGMTPAVYLGV